MVDSRVKGAKAETVVRDRLRELTELQWERVPSSGALDPKHGLKGDLYIPNEKNLYCVEVKHYADDQLSSSLFTAKEPNLLVWWEQTVRQGKQVSKLPLLIFKHDRSKLFAAFQEYSGGYNHIYIDIGNNSFNIALLDDWLINEDPQFIA